MPGERGKLVLIMLLLRHFRSPTVDFFRNNFQTAAKLDFCPFLPPLRGGRDGVEQSGLQRTG
jgi:hypothetical protein